MPPGAAPLPGSPHPPRGLHLAQERKHLGRLGVGLLGQRGGAQPVARREQPVKLARRRDLSRARRLSRAAAPLRRLARLA
jgi:hypothetical protein